MAVCACSVPEFLSSFLYAAFIHGQEQHIFGNRMFCGWEYITFHGHCTDNKKLGLLLWKTLVQIVRVVLGSVYQFWSKTYGSICENLPL